MRVTYLSLSDDDKTLAAMRSAQLRLGLSEYIATLVRHDAREAGLVEFLGGSGDAVDGRTVDEGRTR